MTFVLFLIITCAVAIFSQLVIARWKQRRLHKFAKLFPGPPTWPIVGNGLEFTGSPHNIMTNVLRLLDEYQTPFRVWVGPILLIVVGDPGDVQIVLNNSKTLEKNDMYKFFVNTVGEGLFSAPVEKWKRHRRIITPAFNMRLLRSFFPVFNKKNRTLVEKLKVELDTGKHFDLWKYIAPTSLDIICETALGYDLKTQDAESEFADALIKASELDCMRIYKPWLHPDIIFNIVSYLTDLKKVYRVLHKLPMQVISEKRKDFQKWKHDQLKHNDIDENTLLELNESGANFTDTEIMDEVITMMIGGSETSALTNCFTLLMLAIHQDVQEKVYEEICAVFDDEDIIVSVEDVCKLTYLEQCLKETLRLFPVGPMFLRKAQDDVQIKNYIIPAGASIIIPPIKVHRNADIYPNPLNWNPENFAAETTEKRHKYSFIAFSGGPRGCIGSKYAMLSMKVLISMLLRNYHITTDVKMQDIKLKLDLLLRSVDGYQIKLHSRTSSS